MHGKKKNGSKFPHFDGPQFPVSTIITQCREIINSNGEVLGPKQCLGYIIPLLQSFL